MSLITHIIYDCDGLLLDTERLNRQVNQTIASRYGKVFDETVHRQIIGRTASDSAQILINRLDLPITIDDYLQQRYELVTDLYPTAQPLPGAKILTEHFAAHGIPQAIATSSIRQRFDQKFIRHQSWMRLFACIVTGDDEAIKYGKPAPDTFLVTAERLGADPINCLVFEDSPAGVIAAKKAGMAVVAVPAKDSDSTIFQLADSIVNSLLEFDPTHWRLPPLSPARDK
ncbi:MAG: HAD-IA family hydrolase [Leptolyngbyaceae cyanobacterium MO_188.B28]|nr:HAD-IA family hydrolase [Leptolyngbyaceae cyanobacterium MO_188.B28]